MQVEAKQEIAPDAPPTSAELNRVEASCVCRCGDPRCNARIAAMAIRELKYLRGLMGTRS